MKYSDVRESNAGAEVSGKPGLAVAALFLLTSTAMPECIDLKQSQAFRSASVVFRGTVTRIDDAPAGEAAPTLGGIQWAVVDRPKIVTFSVNRVWKGPAAPTVKVSLVEHPSMGTVFRFSIGTEYVVYAIDEDARDVVDGLKVYDVGACRLRIRTDVESESRILGKATVPSGTLGTKR